MKTKLDISPRAARLIIWALVLAYILLFSWLSVTRHLAFKTDAYDMGNVNQAFWNTVHGRPLYFTNWRGVELTLATDTRLAMHVEPIYFLIAPIYWLWQRPETLLVLQTVILALGAWPVYWLARDYLKNYLAAVIFAAVYLLFPGLQAANLWEFHAVALAAPFLLFAFYFGHRRKWALLWLFAILAMATKEEIPLIIFLMGLYFALSDLRQAWASSEPGSRPWRQWLKRPGVVNGLALALVAILWFVIAVFVIIPHFEGERSPYLSYYDNLAGDRAGVKTIPFTDLPTMLMTLFSGRNLKYLIDLYTPVAFLSLLNPLTAAFSLPDLLINLLSDHEPMHFVQKYHYTAPLIPGIMISAILGAAWLARRLTSRSRRRFPAAALLLALVVLGASFYYHYYHGYTPLARAFEGYTLTDHDRLGERIAGQIPTDASVSAQRHLNPHVSGRQTLYRFPYIGDAEYVFIDIATLANEGNQYEIVRDLLAGDEFGLVLAEDGYLLFQRGVDSQSAMDDEFYDFARVPLGQADFQPQYPLDVTFGDALRLIGFDVFAGRHTEMPQTPLRFVLYWQVLEPMAEDYQIALYLLDDQRQVIGGPDFSREPGIVPYWFPTSQWQPGEIIRTEFRNMPWWTAQFDEYSVALGLLQGDDPWDVGLRLRPKIDPSPLLAGYAGDRTLVELLDFETDAGGMPVIKATRRRSEAPTGVTRQSEQWDNGIQLLGYDIPQRTLRTGDRLAPTLYWRTQNPLDTDYKVFVHMVGEDGKLYGQHDAEPDMGSYPTSQWQPGDVIPDTHYLEIGEDAPPGRYSLYVGFYNPANGERVPLAGGGDFVTLQTQVTVK